MKKFKRKLMLLTGSSMFLFLLTGCANVMGKDGKVMEKFIISASTTFGQIFKDESWFTAIFVYPVAKLINILAPLIGVTLAIAAVTLAINLITLVFTVKSTVASQKMQMLQPEMTKITKKYEGKTDERSKMAQAQETQALYTKNGINPFGTILTTFIQFPIILAMYQAVQRAEAVVHGSLWGLSLEISPLKGIQSGQWMYLVLFAVMALAQILSMKMPTILANLKIKRENVNKKHPTEKQKQPGGNMMIWSFGFIMILSISWPAAMTIYWLISSLVTIAKTVFVQYVYIEKKEGK